MNMHERICYLQEKYEQQGMIRQIITSTQTSIDEW